MPAVLQKPVYMADMAILLSDQLSANIGKTVEGYLICHDVPVARIGMQRYLGKEIGLKGPQEGMIFDVARLPEDVFSRDTLASFEAKPITDGHPDGIFVAPDNYAALAKGHAQNVRQVGDHIVMDLVITDPNLISKVENKVVREVSMGYSCYYAEHGDTFKQVLIRGNHIAIVDRGRAGQQVSIKDAKPKGTKMKTSARTQVMKALAAAEVEDAVFDEAMKAFDGEPKNAAVATEDKAPTWLASLITAIKPKAVKDESEEEKDDDDESKKEEKAEDRLTKMEASLDKLTKLVEKSLAATTDESEEELEKVLAEEEKSEAEDSDKDEEKEAAETQAKDAAAIIQLAKDLKPLMAKMSVKDRDAMKNMLRKASKGEDASGKSYAGIAKAVESHAAKNRTRDAQTADTIDHVQRGKDIAAKYNPHYKHLRAVDKK